MDPSGSVTLVGILAARASQTEPSQRFRYYADGKSLSSELSFTELHRWSRNLAINLLSRHEQSERVVLAFPQGTEFLIAFWACLQAGLIAVPAPAVKGGRGVARLASILRDCRATTLLSTPQGLQAASAASAEFAGLHLVGVETTNHCSQVTDKDLQQPDTNSIAFIQYTSGSISEPKGVCVTHSNLMANCEMVFRAMAFDSESRVASWLPCFHDMGLIGSLLQPVYAGISCDFMPPSAFLQNPMRWLELISRVRATHSGGPNFAYELLARSFVNTLDPCIDLSSWRVAWNGSEPIQASTLESFNKRFLNAGFDPASHFPCYGLAESTLMVTSAKAGAGAKVYRARQSEDLVSSTPDLSDRELVSCGKTNSVHDVAIVDPVSLSRLAEGETGELWVRGPSVSKHYWERQQESAFTFGAVIRELPETTWLRTGDLGFVIEGEVFVSGRLKELIILAGRNVYPSDLESTAQRAHAAINVGGCAAFAVEINGSQRVVIACELERTARRTNPEEIRSVVRAEINAAHEVSIAEVLILKPGGLPRTTSGKVQRGIARNRFMTGELSGAATGLEKKISMDSTVDTSNQISKNDHRTSPMLNLPPFYDNVDRRISDEGVLVSKTITRMQRRHFVIFDIVPAVGTIVAVAALFVAPVPLYVIISAILMYIITGLGITVGFHRYFTHKSFRTSAVLESILAIAGMMAAVGPVITWVAIHRRHHQFSDREGDPHSPHLYGSGLRNSIRGFLHAQMGWTMEHPLPNPHRYAKDLLLSTRIVRLNNYYSLWAILGVIVPSAVCAAFSGSWSVMGFGLLWVGCVRLFALHHIIASVNSVCHMIGTRAFATREQSTNNWALAIPTLGEAWHNNHHAFQTSAALGHRWYQVDLGYMTIVVLRALSLVYDVKRPSDNQIKLFSEKSMTSSTTTQPLPHSTHVTQSDNPSTPNVTKLVSNSGSSSPLLTVKEIVEIVAQATNTDKKYLSGSSQLRQLGLDSLGVTNLVIILNQEFNVTVPVDALLADISINDLTTLINKLDGYRVVLQAPTLEIRLVDQVKLDITTQIPKSSTVSAKHCNDLPKTVEVFWESLRAIGSRFEEIRDKGLYCYEPPLASCDPPYVMIGEERALNLSSYSYLGLSNHPAVIGAGVEALQRFGPGTMNTRLGSGTTVVHKELESRIAQFFGREDAALFPTGYDASVGSIPVMVGPGDTVIADQYVHACVIDGIRLSGANMVTVNHNDMNDLESALASCKGRRRMVAVDAVYSMEGDIANLPVISYLCRKYGAILLADEAHSVGVIGRTGRGLEEHWAMPAGTIDIKLGTLSKAIPATGGYITGRSELITAIRHSARNYIFSASTSPVMTNCALAAWKILEAEPLRVARIQSLGEVLRRALNDAGIDTFTSSTAIVPINCRDTNTAFQMAKECRARGLLLFPVVYPVVPNNAPRLRACANASMDNEMILGASRMIAQAAKVTGLV